MWKFGNNCFQVIKVVGPRKILQSHCRKYSKKILLLTFSFVFSLKCIQLWFAPRFELEKCVDGKNAKDFVEVVSFQNGRQHKLNCIPRSPGISSPTGNTYMWLNEDLAKPFLRIPENISYAQNILILTPIRDSEKYLGKFIELLARISYPHSLISVYFGEEGSSDDSFSVAEAHCKRLTHEFGYKHAEVISLNLRDNNPTNRNTRHLRKYQIARRSHLAKVRNYLMKYSLGTEDWILWMDVDVISYRADVIQQFLFANKDVMAASCLKVPKSFFSDIFFIRNYDKNTFRETIIDGFQYRIWLVDLKSEGRVVPIDYVGASCLMIRANAVRKGLYFTEQPYRPLKLKCTAVTGIECQLNLESEGLAKVAREMGLSVAGLPYLEVYHSVEVLLPLISRK